MDACASCDFDPDSEDMEQRVRSAYFSVSRFDDASARKDYERELDDLGQRIARGDGVETRTEDMTRLREFLAEGKGWSARDSLALVAFAVGWLGTPIVLIVFGFWILSRC